MASGRKNGTLGAHLDNILPKQENVGTQLASDGNYVPSIHFPLLLSGSRRHRLGVDAAWINSRQQVQLKGEHTTQSRGLFQVSVEISTDKPVTNDPVLVLAGRASNVRGTLNRPVLLHFTSEKS